MRKVDCTLQGELFQTNLSQNPVYFMSIFWCLLYLVVGLPWHKSGSQNATSGGQHHNFDTNLKIVSNFFVAKLGYQQPKSGSPGKF